MFIISMLIRDADHVTLSVVLAWYELYKASFDVGNLCENHLRNNLAYVPT